MNKYSKYTLPHQGHGKEIPFLRKDTPTIPLELFGRIGREPYEVDVEILLLLSDRQTTWIEEKTSDELAFVFYDEESLTGVIEKYRRMYKLINKNHELHHLQEKSCGANSAG